MAISEAGARVIRERVARRDHANLYAESRSIAWSGGYHCPDPGDQCGPCSFNRRRRRWEILTAIRDALRDDCTAFDAWYYEGDDGEAPEGE